MNYETNWVPDGEDEKEEQEELGPEDVEYQVAIPVADARHFGWVANLVAQRNFEELAGNGFLAGEDTVVDEEQAKPGFATIRLGGIEGRLARKLDFPADQEGDVQVAISYNEVAALDRLIRQDGLGLWGMIDIAEWLPGERQTAKRILTSHINLMDRFVEAGGEDNPRLRAQNEKTLMYNRVWGGEALPEDYIDHI